MALRTDASKVRLLLLDADGTLTDGGIVVDGHGLESKRFSVRDGFGMRAWLRSGREIAVITGRGEMAVRHRLADLGVRMLVSASGPKGPVVESILARCGVDAGQTAAMGDDLPDLPMLHRVGYPMAVGVAVRLLGASRITLGDRCEEALHGILHAALAPVVQGVALLGLTDSLGCTLGVWHGSLRRVEEYARFPVERQVGGLGPPAP